MIMGPKKDQLVVDDKKKAIDILISKGMKGLDTQ